MTDRHDPANENNDDLFDADHLLADSALREAVVDLRSEVDRLDDPPPFAQARSGAPLLAAAAVVLVALAGLFAWSSNRDDDLNNVATATQTPTAAVATEPTPAEQSPTAAPSTPSLVRTATEADVAPLDRPAAGSSVVDPAFGQTITPVTSAISGQAITPQIGNPWNADESLLLLYRTGGAHLLYDAETFELLGELDINPADIEQVYWSVTDPAILYFVERGTPDFVAYNVSAVAQNRVNSPEPEYSVVYTFENCASVKSGASPVAPSNDGQLFGLICYLDDDKWAVAFDLADGELGRVAVPENAWYGPMPYPDGSGFLHVDGSDVAQRFDRTMTPVGDPYEAKHDIAVLVEHPQWGPVAVGVDFKDRSGTIVAHSVDNSTSLVAIGEAVGFPSPPPGNLYGRAASLNGDVVVGVGLMPDTPTTVLGGEIVVGNLGNSEASGARVAHHRSTGSFDDTWSGPFVAINQSGTKVLFSSDWGGDRVDTYLIILSEPI